MESSWRLLSLPSDSSCIPQLLAKFDFKGQGYEFILTDLTEVWSETIDPEGIRRRAFDEDTSIDPSEDYVQFMLLLRKVREALLGENGAELHLEHLHDKRLALRIESPLPSPLPPLRWSMYLSPATSRTLTTELVLPLLIQSAEQAQRERSLLASITEKDHVVGKLVDKLDSAGVEVSAVFLSAQGSATGKKGLSWDGAGKAIRGLAPFDELAWRDQTNLPDTPRPQLAAVLKEVITGDSSGHASRLHNLDSVLGARNWWEQLGRSDQKDSCGFITLGDNLSVSTTANTSLDQKANSKRYGSDNDFEVSVSSSLGSI